MYAVKRDKNQYVYVYSDVPPYYTFLISERVMLIGNFSEQFYYSKLHPYRIQMYKDIPYHSIPLMIFHIDSRISIRNPQMHDGSIPKPYLMVN